MHIAPVSELFEDQGIMITPTTETQIQQLDRSEIIALFERYGVIVFRGFQLQPNEISKVTDIYSERYSKDAVRRKERFEQKVVRDVDTGCDAHTLHSEASYSLSAWPEIVWFYCNIAPTKDGQTTLCDGIRLWKALSGETKLFFLSEPLRFDLNIPVGDPKPGRGKKVWIANVLGTQGYMDWENGALELTQLTYAMNESRSGKDLCFANHLLAELGKDPQIKNEFMQTATGKRISPEMMDEIKVKAEECTYEHNWQKGDLIMIDNKRFMHGRRSFPREVPRDIVNVQTARASFGFGGTLRTSITERSA